MPNHIRLALILALTWVVLLSTLAVSQIAEVGAQSVASGCAEGWQFEFDGRDWYLAHVISDQGATLFEYVQRGQHPSKYREIVNISLLENARSTELVRLTADAMRDDLRRTDPSCKWSEAWLGEADLVYEWQHAGDDKWPALQNITRMAMGRNGLHHLHYEVQEDDYDEARYEDWRRRIMTAKLAMESAPGPAVDVPVPMSDGSVIRCCFVAGDPIRVNSEWAKVVSWGVIGGMSPSGNAPQLAYRFVMDIKRPGVRQVRVTDVTDPNTQLLVDDALKADAPRTWVTITAWKALTPENWPDFYDPDTGTVRAYYVEMTDANGNTHEFHQLMSISRTNKQAVMRVLGVSD